MKNFLTKLYVIHDWLTQIAAIVASIGLMLIVTFYVYEVVTRYFFNSPTAWVSDFVSYILCASIFLALPKVTQEKGHVAVTILIDIMPARPASYLQVCVSLIGFISLAFAAYISFRENLRQIDKNIETLAIIPIPQWWVSSFITVGLLLSAFYFLRHATPQEEEKGDPQFHGEV